MESSGVRARNFIQPAPGGASAIFARQRGMVAPAPMGPNEVQEDPNKEGRSGKASGRDYADFLDTNKGVIKGVVNSLKNVLVGTFVAAKSLGKTLKGVLDQVKGMGGGGGGGGGFLGGLVKFGLIGAIVAGVSKMFAPQIQKAFEWVKGGADGIFQDVKGKLDGLDKQIESFYETVRGIFNNNVIGAINLINTVVGSLKDLADKVFHLPKTIPFMRWEIPIPFMDTIKGWGKSAYTTFDKALIKVPEKLKPYRDTVDANGKPIKGILGKHGINFLAQYNDVGSLGMGMATGAGNLAMGGIENSTGLVGDIVNNILASLGLTGMANTASSSLGMGNLFGQSRELGSGPGIPSLMNQGNTTSGNYASGAGGLTPQQRAFLETVSFAEGTQNPESYNTWFTGMKFPPEQPDLSKYTIKQVMDLQDRFLAEGHGRYAGGKSAAVGKYQMTYPETYAEKAGLDINVDKFTPENQDKMALYGYIMTQGGVTEAEINAPEISDQTIDKLAPVFASYPNLFGPGKNGKAPGDGVSYYPSQGAKYKNQIKERYRNEHAAAMQNAQPAPAAPTPPPASQSTTTPTPVVKPASSKTTTPKQQTGSPVAFIPTNFGGQPVAVAKAAPPPTVAPRNPGGASPNQIFHSPSNPDVLAFHALPIFTE